MLYVLTLQVNPEFLKKPIVLLMDAASPHVSEATLFPVYTVNIFQACDMVFFLGIQMMKQTAAGEFGPAFAGEPIGNLLQAGEQMVA
jgi:hypothetical protein